MTIVDQELVLSEALRWLYDIEQPDDAVLNHHGIRLPGDGNRNFGVCPAGWRGHPVIVINVTTYSYTPDGCATPTLHPEELDRTAVALADLGQPVSSTWNGIGVTGSIALVNPAHPTLQAAVRRYHAGCPLHRSMFHNVDCSWYATGYSRVIQPRRLTDAGSGGVTALPGPAGICQ